MKKTILTLIAIMMLTLSYAQIGTHIPVERLPFDDEDVLEWTKAGCLENIRDNGGLIIEKFIDVTNDLEEDYIVGNTLSEKIQFILDLDEDDTNYNQSLLFYFPPGEYEIDETITVNRDSVVFRGAGADKTTLLFTKEWYKCSAWEDLTGNGQYEWIIQGYERNDDLFKVTGNYIGLENLKIDNQLDPILITVDSGYEEEGYNGNFVSFSGSNNSWIAGVHMKKSRRHHVKISHSDNIEVRGCYFHKSYSYGGGGNGYGVCLANESRYCLIENNIFGKLRHAMIFGNDSKYNVVSYNYQKNSAENRNVSSKVGHFSSLILFIITSPFFRYFQVY